MESIGAILATASTALGLLITTATFLMKFLKNAKARKAAETLIELSNAVLPYVKQAESFVNYSGAEKKEFVITKANQFAIEHGLSFDLSTVSTKIEELVTLSKSINTRDKDKICSAISHTAAEYCDCMNKPLEELKGE